MTSRSPGSLRLLFVPLALAAGLLGGPACQPELDNGDGDLGGSDVAAPTPEEMDPDGGLDRHPPVTPLVLAGTTYEPPESCGGAKPTWLGGEVYGHEDSRRSLNALIGIDHHDAEGTKIDAEGIACGQPGSHCCGGYSWCFRTNPDIPADGALEPDLERRWGRCVSSRATRVFIEMYPKNPAGVTTQTRYGEAAHHYQDLIAGGRNVVDVRLPSTYEAAAGNTGGIQGYVTCNGAPVAPERITRVRAWSEERGPACGVQGFNASATQLASGAGGTYYAIDHLAAGQCGAPDQPYRFYMDVECNGAVMTQKKYLDVVRGVRPRVDWAF